MEVMADFNAKEFFELGLKIAHAHDYECGYRTAIGRLYYACHLIGIDATEQKGWFSPKYGAPDHSALWRVLKEHHVRGVGDKLRELVELREHADYHIKKRSTGGCQYCEHVAEGVNLVNKQTWERAESIASDILPKLEAIYPQQHK
jgi:hypothetical protein